MRAFDERLRRRQLFRRGRLFFRGSRRERILVKTAFAGCRQQNPIRRGGRRPSTR